MPILQAEQDTLPSTMDITHVGQYEWMFFGTEMMSLSAQQCNRALILIYS